MALVCLFAITIPSFAQATQTAYAQQNPDVLRSLFERADSRADSLLVRYRLYPLTGEEALRSRLQKQNLAPLYKQFLKDPPDI